jgi:hypothetical protein
MSGQYWQYLSKHFLVWRNKRSKIGLNAYVETNQHTTDSLLLKRTTPFKFWHCAVIDWFMSRPNVIDVLTSVFEFNKTGKNVLQIVVHKITNSVLWSLYFYKLGITKCKVGEAPKPNVNKICGRVYGIHGQFCLYRYENPDWKSDSHNKFGDSLPYRISTESVKWSMEYIGNSINSLL